MESISISTLRSKNVACYCLMQANGIHRSLALEGGEGLIQAERAQVVDDEASDDRTGSLFTKRSQHRVSALLLRMGLWREDCSIDLATHNLLLDQGTPTASHKARHRFHSP